MDIVVTDLGNTPCNSIDGCAFGPTLTGPFLGGETVLAHVMVTSDTSFTIRGAQIDWRASSSELVLVQDADTVNQGIDGIPNFWFDYSPIVLAGIIPQGTYPATGVGSFGPSTGSYTDFSNLQQGIPPIDFVASTVWALTSESSGMLTVTAGSSRFAPPGSAPGYSMMSMRVPTSTRSNSSITSALCMLMQPWDNGPPRDASSGVP